VGDWEKESHCRSIYEISSFNSEAEAHFVKLSELLSIADMRSDIING